MKTPPVPEGEAERLRALASYEILDSLPEPDFDEITQIASEICGTETALISLVDADRQWFKAKTGFERSELPREVSFCGHAITAGEPVFEVPDARADERFRDNPLVVDGPRIGFYAGAPLVTETGYRIGALCVIDPIAKRLTEGQRRALRALANQVMARLELRRQNLEGRSLHARVKRTSDLLQLIFDTSKFGLAVVREPEFIFEKVNRAFEILVGPRRYLNRKWREVYGDTSDDQLFRAMSEVYTSGVRHLESERLIAVPVGDGSTEDRYFNFSYDRLDQNESGFYGILIQCQDVTTEVNHRKAAERQALAQTLANQRLVQILKAMPVGVSLTEGSDHRHVFENETFGRYVTPGQPDARLACMRDQAFRTGQLVVVEEFRIEPSSPPSDSIVRLGVQPLADDEGRVYGLVTTIVDITESARIRTELRRQNAKLSHTENLLNTAIDVARVGFFDWDVARDEFVLSAQFQKDWGVGAGGRLNDLLPLVHPDDRERVMALVDRSLASGEGYHAEYRVVRPTDGRTIWLEAQGNVTRSEAGQTLRFFGTTVDITERKSLELITNSVANSIPQFAWMTDASGEINWYNQRWYDYTGTTFEAMRGWGWQAVHHPDEVDRVTEKIKHSFETGEPWEDTFPLRGADGAYRWFLSRAMPIRDSYGKIINWFGTNTDVTEQREAEIELSRMAAVVQNSKDFIAMYDAEFRPIFVNAGGRAMTGFGSRDLTELQLEDFFPDADRDIVHRDVLPTVREGAYWEGEVRLVNFTTGGAIPVLYNLFPLNDRATGTPIGFATVTRDISERKAFEESLENARLVAERANQAKSAFLANMSHEIRSPLGAIMGFADLLRSPDVAAADLANYTSVIDRNSKHLLRIVDDILDLSKVEAGMLMIETIHFSLLELLSDFASMMGFKAREKGIRFDLVFATAIPNPIVSDPTRLRQILMNVVTNAIKFTTRGRVELAVTFAGRRLSFRVTDTGIGLSADQRERLFTPFQQADSSTTRKYGGTGLGLILTQRLCEAMGGTFRLEKSELGRGSTFEAAIAIELPTEARMIEPGTAMVRARPEQVVDASRPLAGVRILLIEDSPDNQVLINLILGKLGAVVELANDGREGVDLALARPFDLVLCDMQMPRLDGYETVRELRGRGYRVPIVALTAHAMKEEYAKAMAAGFSDYLTKPIQKAELVTTLVRHARRT